LGYVVDFVDFQVGSFDFAVFNVADACIVIGAGLLLLAGSSASGARPRRPAARAARRCTTGSADEPNEAAPADQVGR
jgi:hypothetical protein